MLSYYNRFASFLALNLKFSASCIFSGQKCTDWCAFWSTSAGVAVYMWVNNSGLIAMHEPYKSNNILCKNTFGVKKVWPSKVESYL